MNETHESADVSLIQRYRETMEAIARDGEGALPLLRELCHEQVQFEDPLQSVTGVDAYIETNRRLVKRARSVSINVGTVLVQDGHLFSIWTLTVEPPMGPVMTIDGSTHATIREGLITYQRDYWDLLSSAADALPGLGMVYRRLVSLFT